MQLLLLQQQPVPVAVVVDLVQVVAAAQPGAATVTAAQPAAVAQPVSVVDLSLIHISEPTRPY